jgi:RHS repeat-associated protein
MLSTLRLQQTATHWWTNSYGWDAAHRLSSVTSPAGTFTYGYDGSGTLRTGYSAPGGSVTNLYDSQGRMTLTAWKNTSGTVLNAHGYELDAVHQRTRQTRTNIGLSHSHTLGYQYDAAGQVTHARATNNATGLAVTGELLGLTYDAAWNMTARTNGATVNYGVNNLNQVTGDGGTYTYTYDSNGNRTYRTKSGGAGYVMMVYDDENQLIRQETDTSATLEGYRFKLEYLYDGKLRLRERKYSTWQYGSWYPTSTERYVYDGMQIVQERNTGTPAVTYTRGVDLSASLDGAGGIGGLLARSHGFNSGTGAWSTHSAYHADGNGNVTALFSTSTGSQVAWYRYDAFGRLLQSSGSLSGANRMRFSSKPWMAPAVDDSAGMYYYGYRFYDPLTQRWVNRDPIGETGGFNIYCFNLNAPIYHVDSDGRWTYGAGFQCVGGAILGVEFSGGVFVGRDPCTGKWSGGLLFAPGFGLQTPALGCSGFAQMTAAPSVASLKGFGAHVGGAFAGGPMIGADFLMGPRPGGVSPLGAEIVIGLGAGAPIPAEAHHYGTYTFGIAF